MSERSSARQQCELRLKAVSDLCLASSNALGGISSSPSTSEPLLATIHADFLSLLSLIYHIATKLALALNPTEPAFSAAISPLDDLVKHVHAITSCASLFSTTFGLTLRTEVVGLTLDVLQATKAFTEHCVLITDEAMSPSELKRAHLYLVGSLHELIDNSHGSDGLSKDNLQAVRKKWSQDLSVLEDGYRELSELLTPDEAHNDSFDEDFGGEDCLTLESTPLTPEEAERVKKVQKYIRITNLFHERVYIDLLKPSALKVASSSPSFASTLDEISCQSTQFVSVTDEIISCLHSPQDPKALSASLRNLGEVATILQRLLNQNDFLPKPQEQSLELQMESMTVGVPKAGQKKVMDTRKWFDTCIDQVEKLRASLSAEFNG